MIVVRCVVEKLGDSSKSSVEFHIYFGMYINIYYTVVMYFNVFLMFLKDNFKTDLILLTLLNKD